MELTTRRYRSELIARCSVQHIQHWMTAERFPSTRAKALLDSARFVQHLSPEAAHLFRALLHPEGRYIFKYSNLKRFHDALQVVHELLADLELDYWRDYVNAIAWPHGLDTGYSLPELPCISMQ